MQQGPLKLRKCVFPVKGYFEWWYAHNPKRSNGLKLDEDTNVVFLDPDARTGTISGCIRLPKNCVFRIDMALKIVPVNVRLGDDDCLNASESEGNLVEQASEKLVFYVGSDFDGLQEHTFSDQAGNPIRVGKVSLEFYGARLCFSVVMSRRMGMRPNDAQYRLCLANSATYEERLNDFREEESRMRLIQKESHVLSELVKTLRMQTKKTSSERCADLLQELVQVETSTAKTWDSALLHDHLQRFERAGYAAMLRVEIKKEVSWSQTHTLSHSKVGPL